MPTSGTSTEENFPFKTEVKSTTEAELTIDLKPLIEARRDYEAALKRDPNNDDYASNLKSAFDKCKSIRDELGEELRELYGQAHWVKIEEAIVPEDYRESLASHQLHESFVELIKNSMDALVYQHLKADAPDSLPTSLSLNVSVDCSNGDIAIKVRDNGGGMPAQTLNEMDGLIKNKELLEDSKRHESNKSSRLDFGGAGKGLRILIATFAHLGSFNQKGKDPGGTTKIQIANEEGGLAISVHSPKAPLKLKQVDKRTMLDDRSKSQPNLSLNFGGKLKKGSLLERRRLKQGNKSKSAPTLTIPKQSVDQAADPEEHQQDGPSGRGPK